MISLTDPNAIYEQIIADNPQVTLNARTYWVVEGDLLMDTERILAYAFARAEEAQRSQAGEPMAELDRLLATAGADGRIVRWRKGKELTYTVCYDTFQGKDADYQQVVTAMHEATRDWEAACAVKFRHLSQFDKAPPSGQDAPLFDVRRRQQNPDLLALAFFPTDPKDLRHIWLDTAFFNPKRNPYTMAGVLRHELGHVLGFRHEHIRQGAPLSCKMYRETMANAVELTPFDPTSVMHYQCLGVTTKNPTWQLSAKDRTGAQAIYGTPDGKVVPPDHKMDYRD